jgi:ParB-like chromosome segregation protein Spo0J
VVDGERPLKFPKLRSWVPVKNLDLHLYLTSKDILRAFHKNKYRSEFNPDTEKIADIVLTYFFTRCPSGGGHG